MPYTYDDPRLPFVFDLPDCAKKTEDHSGTNSSMVFENINKSLDCHINLHWGPMEGTKPSVPLFWTKLAESILLTPHGAIELLIAGTGKFLVNLLRFVILGLFVWSIATALIGSLAAVAITAIIALPALYFIVITSVIPQIKCAFLYQETEYVFTVHTKSSWILTQYVLPSLRFKAVPTSTASRMLSERVQETVTTKRAATSALSGTAKTIVILAGAVVVAELAAFAWRPLAVTIYSLMMLFSVWMLTALFSMYVGDFKTGDTSRTQLSLRIEQTAGAMLVFFVCFFLLSRQLYMFSNGGFAHANTRYDSWFLWGVANLAESLLDLPSIYNITISQIVPMDLWARHLTMAYRAWQELVIIVTALAIWNAVRKSSRKDRQGPKTNPLRKRTFVVVVLLVVFWLGASVLARYLNLWLGGFSAQVSDLLSWGRFGINNLLESILLDAPTIYQWEITSIAPTAFWSQTVVFLLRAASSLLIADSIMDIID